VTDTDVELEAFLRKEILTKFPEETFIGEESANSVDKFDHEPCWILDPIDGTANFVHGISNVAISLAYSEKGQIVMGIVYNPIQEELFTAVRQGGAFLDDVPITVSDVDNWNEAIVCTEFGSDRSVAKSTMMVENLKLVLDEKVQGIRATGSAALNLCYVAAGRFDVYYVRRLSVFIVLFKFFSVGIWSLSLGYCCWFSYRRRSWWSSCSPNWLEV